MPLLGLRERCSGSYARVLEWTLVSAAASDLGARGSRAAAAAWLGARRVLSTAQGHRVRLSLGSVTHFDLRRGLDFLHAGQPLKVFEPEGHM